MNTPQPPEGTTATFTPGTPIAPLAPSAPLALPGYRLAELHLYNWGAFAGRHQVSVDVGNTAIIGPTGSGKTTLIDALMTLLCATPRYNLASTGGHESDRDLVSYVRGATGPGHAGDDSNHLARTGRCVTAMAARLVREHGTEGASDTVLIGCVLWFEGSSSSVADLTRRWFFARGTGHSLDLWLEEHHRGGARALSQLVKNTDGLQMFNSKSTYLARLQGFFEVGPMAFTLLNRAAGLKQLNSIDEIFRDLVLDDHAAYDDALQVAASFDELADIHAELELANHQFMALLPLRDMALQEQQLHLRLHQWRGLHAALPHWFATQGARLWEARCTELQATLTQHQQGMATARTALEAARAHEQHLHGLYLRTGGGDIQLLEQHLLTQQAEVARKQNHLADCHLLLRNLGLNRGPSGSGPLNAALLAQHQQQAETALHQLQAHQAALQATTEEAVTAERNAHADVQRLQTELDAVRQRPGSNLPSEFPAFRAALAAQLNLPPDDLPFVAELVEVQKNQQAWRGAIERALGAQRLRILVPPHAIAPALQWVNQRHNHLHVRLLEAKEPKQTESFWADGFATRLNIKPHPLQAALRQLLREQDRHCVDSPEALRHTPHAMTQQGLMSGKAQQFDKQDHKRLEQDWMTGFDNRDRLAHLTQQIKERTQVWQALDQAKKAAQAAQANATAQLSLWQRLLTLRFEDLDVPAAQTLLQQLQAKRDALLNPHSDTAQAKARWEAASGQTGQADDTLRGLETQHATAQEAHRQAQKKQQEYATRMAEQAAATASLPATAMALAAATTHTATGGSASQADTLLPLLMPAFDPTSLTCDTLETQERQSLAQANQQVQSLSKQQADLHKDIIRQMGRAQKEDRGTLAEQTQEVEALAHYLERLRVLEEEDLPAKRARFQEYLNNASEQGVNTLLRGIDAQVAEISERIADLNRTLQRVDFQPGRTLQLDPQPVVHPVLQDLHKSMASLRSERLRDDGGTSHYQALQAMVQLLREHATNRRSKAAQALLDARYRLQFAVHVIDRETGQVLERRTGSQGGSGGEKEIIASYVLTASLSYALCSPGRKAPLFGTIVLDEAFSKSSAAVAARIIQALREFGLHALFVTPNKELRLLRNHTRSAVLVHRRGAQATLACLSWEELNAHANHRKISSEISL
jgi:uncharacterized protein YPO0396